MTHQTLTRPRPERAHPGTGLAAVPLHPGAAAPGRRPAGRPATRVVVPFPQAPRASFRQRVAGWRARNWRRAVLAWFVVSLLAVVAAAEPATAFPMAQVGSVALRVVGALTVAGIPIVLIALP